MSLFNRPNTAEKEVNFNKNKVIQEIIQCAPEEMPDWTIVRLDSDKADFVCVSSIEIKREISITSNPFSNYKNVIPFESNIVFFAIINNIECDNHFISKDHLFNKLKKEKNFFKNNL